MSPKGFLMLGAATIVSVALAVSAVMSRDVPVTSTRVDEALLPGLLDRLNDVATVRITHAGRTTTLERHAQGWTVAEKGGYPADAQKVRDLVLAVANLRLVEAKTREPERLKRLELGDPVSGGNPGADGAPKPEASQSRLVALEDAQGKRLGAIVVGKTRYGLYGPGRAGVYVRRADENQAWLADRNVEVPDEALDWLVKDVVDIPAKELASITLAAGTPDPIVLRRPSREAAALELAGVPEGRKADADKIERVADVVSRLNLQDVKPADQLTVPADAPKALFETADGLKLEVTAVRQGEGDQAEHWLIFSAGPGTPLSAAPSDAGPASAAAGDGATADRTASGAAAASAESPKGEPEKGEAVATPAAAPAVHAAELSRRLQGWAYKVSPYLAERLGWGMDQLLEKPEKTS